MDFEKLYEQYEKEVSKMSNGLIKANKADYLKLVAFYQVFQKESIKEMQSYFVKFPIKGIM
jgi:hypothetical protein